MKGTAVYSLLGEEASIDSANEAISCFEDGEPGGGAGAIPFLPSESMDDVKQFLRDRCFGV